MEEIRQISKAYYDSGSVEEQNLFIRFFRSMDVDEDEWINYREFQEFMFQEGHENMRNRQFFNQLDRDGSEVLEFDEVKTLYYIIKSGRPICYQCKIFIAGIYFTCVRCFNREKSPFTVCLNCYKDEINFRHEHDKNQFLDNFALLESKRKSALTTAGQNENQPTSSQTIVPYSHSHSFEEYPASLAIVPAKRRNHWGTAFRILEAGIGLASLVPGCSIL